MPTSTPIESKGPISERWTELATFRTGPLARARDVAELTNPSLQPPESSYEDNTNRRVPYQSTGAALGRSLSGRLTTSLAPPGSSGIFAPQWSVDFRMEAEKQEKDIQKLTEHLGSLTKILHEEFNAGSLRLQLSTAFEHLVMLGNCLLYVDKWSNGRVYRLDQYVVNRQPDGTVLEVIVKDQVDIQTLPEDVAEKIRQKHKANALDPTQRYVEILTHAIRSSLYEKTYGKMPGLVTSEKESPANDEWTVVQEIGGEVITGKRITRKYLNFIPLRWNANAGEMYGRGLGMDHIGDFRSLEGLYKALYQMAAGSSRFLGMVRPAGMTSLDDLAEAENGEWVNGDPADVAFVSPELRAQMSTTIELISIVERRLQQAFMMTEGFKRDGERVTATEKRMDANELEAGLGGSVTAQSTETLAPIGSVLLENLTQRGVIDKEYADDVDIDILTGFAAIGKQQDALNLSTFIQHVASGGDAALASVNFDEANRRYAESLGVDITNLIKTQEQRQSEQQQQLQTEAATNIAGEVIPAALGQG